MIARIGAAFLLSGLTAGCASNPPGVPVTDNGLTAPVALFGPICERFDHPQVSGGSHWDGRAQLLWEAPDTDVVVGVACGITSLGDGLATLEASIDVRDRSARDLRAFLGQNGIATRATVAP